MEREQIRLELLRLTYAHGRLASEAVARAQELEAYVFEKPQTEAEAPEERPKLSLKKKANPFG